MKKKDIKLQLKEVETFDEAWKLYEECPDKLMYRILKGEVLEAVLMASDKLSQIERIAEEKLSFRLARMVFMQMAQQTNSKAKLKTICLYCEIHYPTVYLYAMRKREKLADKKKDFEESLVIAMDAKSHPIIQNHVLLLSVKLAKNRKDCRSIIAIAKSGFSAYEKVFQKMNNMNR